MSAECETGIDGRIRRAGRFCIAALFQGMMLSSVFVLAGCGPIDPVMRWKVYEARAFENEIVRIRVVETEKVLGGHVYSSPVVELIRRDGERVEIRLYDKPDAYEIVRPGKGGKETRIPLRLVFEGSAIKEFFETNRAGRSQSTP